jgi:uncharacterized protein
VKKRIPIGDLAVGMFVDAHVQSTRDGQQIRHFLAPVEAIYDETIAGETTSKRGRLTNRKHKQVAHDGGLLLSADSHVAALRATGLTLVTIDTDKGADVGLDANPVEVREADGAVDATSYADLLLGDSNVGDNAAASADDCFLDVIDTPTADLGESPKAKRRQVGPPLTAPGMHNGRLHFGASGSAWMKVDIDSAHQAVLRVLSFGGDETLGEKDVLQALQGHYGLRAGLDRQLIRQLAAQAVAWPTRVLRGQFSIAEVEVVPAAHQEVTFTFLDGLEGGADLAYGTLKTAMSLGSIEEVLAQAPLTRAVIPGEKLAVIGSSDAERSVLDIFGRRQGNDRPPLVAGDNVEIVDDSYISQIYGYVCLLDELSVISPLWISPDEVEAHFVDFPQAGTPTVALREWVEQLLAKAGIATGVRVEAFDELRHERPATGAQSILLARGVAAVPGTDAHIEYSFDPKLWPGAFQEDGSVDFHERNAHTRVTSGQFLGTVHPATRGRAGLNLFAQPIHARDGDHNAFDINSKIRMDGNPRRLYARVDGSVRVRGNGVGVHEIVEIHGDVDYSLGNIDAGKDVHISGSVKPGFSVRLAGDLVVGGTIEGGASINSGGDVAVAQGIVGKDTRVVALGNVQAKFVQNSAIMARGDITIGSYLRSCDVRAGGRLVVRQGTDGRGGSIVGGQALAAVRIDVWTVGSASTDRTTIGIVASPDLEAHGHKLSKVVDSCDEFIVRAFRTLGLKTIDVAEMKQLIENTPREERTPIMNILRQIKKVTATRVASLQKQSELERETSTSLQGGEIHVHDTAFADVEIRLGDRRLKLDQDLEKPVFCLTGDDISTE